MNPTSPTSSRPFSRPFTFRPQALLAAIALLGTLPASAAEFSYRYYQFKTTKVVSSGTDIQLSEFSFSLAGTPLNLNNGNTTGVNVVPVTTTSGTQDPNSGEGSNKIVDGSTGTKWFRGAAMNSGNELVLDFGLTPPTVDSYGFTSGGDSSIYARTPQSWFLSGSNDGTTWTLIDARADAITTMTDLTPYGPYAIPADVPPVILAYSVPFGIVLDGTPINFTYGTQFSTSRMMFAGGDPPISLATESGIQPVTLAPNSTAGVTLVALKDGSAAAVNTIVARSVIGGTSTYQFVRYKITKRRPGTAGLVQLSEFEFYNSAVSANKIPIISASNPGGSNAVDAGEGANKLFDGDNGSKWLDGNNKEVIFDFGSPVAFDKYSFVTGNDAPARDAVQWTLEGSNDQNQWVLIEKVDFDYPTPLGRNVSSTPLPLPGASLPASISLFAGSTSTLVEGDSLMLSYATEAAVSVTITPDNGGPIPGPLLLSGSVTVSPTVDTVYTLSAYPAGENTVPVTATVSVFVIPPGVTEIAYDDFSNAGVELDMHGSTTITPPESPFPGRLRLTPDVGSQSGTAWFLKKLDGSAGFEANFGLSLNQVIPTNIPPADGIAFVVQNSPLGTNDPGTGETGLTRNALNVTFRSFGFGPEDASKIQVTSGTTVLATATAYTTPGVELYGIPGIDDLGNILTTGGFPYTLGSLSTDPPYNIRVVYVPGDLDVYLDGIAVIQNVYVDLGEIGATDTSGKSYFGFTARTGGNSQNNDITSWDVKMGDYSAVPPFGIVKTLFRYTAGNPKPTSVDLVWNASSAPSYDIVSSLDLDTWDLISTEFGVDGQIGVSIDIPFAVDTAPKAFFRVEEHSNE